MRIELKDCNYILCGWSLNINGNKIMILQSKETKRKKSYQTNEEGFFNSHRIGRIKMKASELTDEDLREITNEINNKLNKRGEENENYHTNRLKTYTKLFRV